MPPHHNIQPLTAQPQSLSYLFSLDDLPPLGMSKTTVHLAAQASLDDLPPLGIGKTTVHLAGHARTHLPSSKHIGRMHTRARDCQTRPPLPTTSTRVDTAPRAALAAATVYGSHCSSHDNSRMLTLINLARALWHTTFSPRAVGHAASAK